jgi:hypothetical protein
MKNRAKIIQLILQSEYFTLNPPVLIDIGASEEINSKWKEISNYCICIAFDADDREFNVFENTGNSYKKLIRINRIVSDESHNSKSFYLTRSPFCSSTLSPDNEKLKPWFFSELFDVVNKIELPAITINEALKLAGINYIDWFKTDTQGTDLRIYNSLSPEVKNTISIAEFEPGIMDAYKGEDKLFSIMSEMHNNNFWLSDLEVKGTQRYNITTNNEINSSIIKRIVRVSPCWAEVVYLRELSSEMTVRQLLFLVIAALMEEQYGYCLEICDFGSQQFKISIFAEVRRLILKLIKNRQWSMPALMVKRKLIKLLK